MDKWIKCSERMPEAHSRVIIAIEFNDRYVVKIACLESDCYWYDASTYENLTGHVDCWQELPDLPRRLRND